MAETTVMICWVVLKKVPTIEEQMKVTTMVIAIVMIELLLPKILLPIEVIRIGCIVWTLAKFQMIPNIKLIDETTPTPTPWSGTATPTGI